MGDRMEDTLRRILSSHPRPGLSPTFATDIARRAASAARPEHRGGAGLLLAAYWLAAGLATLRILATLPRPAWIGTAAWALAWTAVPLVAALALWPREAARWTALALKPLVADPWAKQQ
jgi:hypothetical protein